MILAIIAASAALHSGIACVLRQNTQRGGGPGHASNLKRGPVKRIVVHEGFC